MAFFVNKPVKLKNQMIVIQQYFLTKVQKVPDFSGNVEIWLVSILNFEHHEKGSQE